VPRQDQQQGQAQWGLGHVLCTNDVMDADVMTRVPRDGPTAPTDPPGELCESRAWRGVEQAGRDDGYARVCAGREQRVGQAATRLHRGCMREG
jgi:hypothetical protein